MPRKKKARSARRKSAAERRAEKGTPEGLGEREFLALDRDYGSFVVEDSEHEPHTFRTGQTAYIMHYGSGESGDAAEDDHWIGRIIDIRGDRPDNVWVRVQWFWSPQEVAEVIKSFDPTTCGKYEKLSSNSYDIISVHSVVDHVEVKIFEENSLYQEAIGDDEWFTRYDFSYDARRITPKPAHVACTICKIPYTPGAVKIHHFCPRPQCRRFYHQACLVKNGYVEETRSRRVLETWPDVDRTASVDDDFYPPRKKQKRERTTPSEGTHNSLADFPDKLVAAADQQIVRGAEHGGVVGNIASVVAARQMIYRSLSGDDLPDDWETKINASVALPGPSISPNCICPECYSPI